MSAFVRSRRANVAVIFALSLVPITLAAGAGLDFARALTVRSEMAAALDAAGLAVGSAQGLSSDQLATLATNYFNANFTDTSYGTPTFTATQGTDQIVLTATVNMPTTLMNVVGISSLPVSFSSTIVWGQTKLWVSLVLDNTGSMCETDTGKDCYSSSNKINTLKTAANDLLAMLKDASAQSGDVKVSIIPFTTDVSIKGLTFNGTQYKSVSWLDWSAYGGSCNIYGIYDQATCTSTHGQWKWFIFYYCTISTYKTQSSCENAVGTWTMKNSSWGGCIYDRDKDYDEKNTTPDPSDSETLFPADPSSSCPVALQPLVDVIGHWGDLTSTISSMSASGSTNQTIGFVWGWQSLTDGDPFNVGTVPDDTQRIIIMLSDGENTSNRWGDGQSTIDAREKAACDNAKADGIVIYTVYVHIGSSGSSSALSYCASDSTKYFDLTSASQITTAFTTIGTQITNLRVAK